jgi:hypothetical protein
MTQRSAYLLLFPFLFSLSIVFSQNLTREQQMMPENIDLHRHVIAVDHLGRLLIPKENASLVPDEDNYLNNIFSQIDTMKMGKGVMFIIHGGLNSEEDALNRAEEYLSNIFSLGYYPIFINWNSGGLSSVKDRLFHIRNGIYKDDLWNYFLGFGYFANDLLISKARFPLSMWNLISENKIAYTYCSNAGDEIYWSIQQHEDNANSLSKQSMYQYDPNSRSTWTSWIPMLNPVKLIGTPLVDGFGGEAWEVMKRRTELLFRPDGDFQFSDPGKSYADSAFFQKDLSKDIGTEARGNGVLTKFFSTWYSKSDTFINTTKVSFLAHSMGTFIANTIQIRYKKLSYRDIVYMGAACSIKDIELGVVPTLIADSTVRFFNLSLHEDREISESWCYGVAPLGSLLHWIDILFEDPKSLSDRTAGSWVNISKSHIIFPINRWENIVLKRFDFEDDEYPIKHGDFIEKMFKDDHLIELLGS